MDALTLDQFLVFSTIVEEGSFSAAARKLGRAQSAITYATQKLEDQTDTLLFDRSAYRPTLTEAGRALLPQARRVLSGLADYRRTANAFTQGLEAEVHLAVDDFVPMQPIYEVLGQFSKTFPDTSVQMHASIDRLDSYLERHPNGLAFSSDARASRAEFQRNTVGAVQLVAVAAPSHPLTSFSPPHHADLLARYFQIVLASQQFPHSGRNRGVLATRRWYADSLHVKQGLILSGHGWGSLPWHMVADDLAAGRLVELSPERWDGADQMPRIPYFIVRSPTALPGPAGAWLFEHLSSKLWPCPKSM